MNEQEKEMAALILKRCESAIKNINHYWTLMKAVKIRKEIEAIDRFRAPNSNSNSNS